MAKYKLRFEVQKKASMRADHHNSVNIPNVLPSFVLVFNDGWDDYDYQTWFALWFVDENSCKRFIGELKILNKDYENTFESLPEVFDTPLSEDFCSLGITSGYYHKLVAVLDDKDLAYSVLLYLRDVAFDVRIRESFENERGYKDSLLRDLSSEKALREAKLMLESRDKDSAFSFNYDFRVPYNERVDVSWNVDIRYRPKTFGRIFGIIGENGVGKTSMLRSLVEDFVSDKNGGFDVKPLFNSLNVISSVSTDRYKQSVSYRNVPYYYYSLDQNRENYLIILGAAMRIVQSHILVKGKSKIRIYYEMVSKIIGESVFIVKSEDNEFGFPVSEEISIDEDAFITRLPNLSSGQLHILSLLTFLVADMHLSSFVIIDEPEVHLHPSSIVAFMTSLSSVLNVFESYAMIATHSPLIIREMLNDNVFLFCRTEENIPHIAKVAYDTFGEDISTLYSRIFGYDESRSIFSNEVARLAGKGVTADKIESILESSLPMNLNARLRIFDIVNQIKGDA